ncbi:hypothetical protein NKH45_33920 [Mesorhizobium sp. M1156]|uniref:hypothetical protein n=1 Tax=Mesorhizobium sp. M1156 TaxID=2957064 RepID=UPI0033385117
MMITLLVLAIVLIGAMASLAYRLATFALPLMLTLDARRSRRRALPSRREPDGSARASSGSSLAWRRSVFSRCCSPRCARVQ